jgi:hypothetical protein
MDFLIGQLRELVALQDAKIKALEQALLFANPTQQLVNACKDENMDALAELFKHTELKTIKELFETGQLVHNIPTIEWLCANVSEIDFERTLSNCIPCKSFELIVWLYNTHNKPVNWSHLYIQCNTNETYRDELMTWIIQQVQTKTNHFQLMFIQTVLERATLTPIHESLITTILANFKDIISEKLLSSVMTKACDNENVAMLGCLFEHVDVSETDKQTLFIVACTKHNQTLLSLIKTKLEISPKLYNAVFLTFFNPDEFDQLNIVTFLNMFELEQTTINRAFVLAFNAPNDANRIALQERLALKCEPLKLMIKCGKWPKEYTICRHLLRNAKKIKPLPEYPYKEILMNLFASDECNTAEMVDWMKYVRPFVTSDSVKSFEFDTGEIVHRILANPFETWSDERVNKIKFATLQTGLVVIPGPTKIHLKPGCPNTSKAMKWLSLCGYLDKMNTSHVEFVGHPRTLLHYADITEHVFYTKMDLGDDITRMTAYFALWQFWLKHNTNPELMDLMKKEWTDVLSSYSSTIHFVEMFNSIE